ADTGLLVFGTEQEVDGVHLLVDEIADGVAALDAAPVLGDLRLLLGDAAKGQAKAAEAAIRSVELCAGARDGDPHRGVRLLVGLREDRARWHREGFALMAEALLCPHLGQAAD